MQWWWLIMSFPAFMIKKHILTSRRVWSIRNVYRVFVSMVSSEVQTEPEDFFGDGILSADSLGSIEIKNRSEARTVDGSEIRRSPVDMVNIPVIHKAIFISGSAGCLNHQQYEFNSNLHTIWRVPRCHLNFTFGNCFWHPKSYLMCPFTPKQIISQRYVVNKWGHWKVHQCKWSYSSSLELTITYMEICVSCHFGVPSKPVGYHHDI